MTDVASGAVKPCSRCHEIKPLDAFSPDSRYSQKRASRCKPCNVILARAYQARHPEETLARKMKWAKDNAELIAARRREVHQALKSAVMAGYGGSCTCCGEDNLAFLTIDHVNNDGAMHRRSGQVASGRLFYQRLCDEGCPPGFQVLCFNCNFAKSQYDGCPHQVSVSK